MKSLFRACVVCLFIFLPVLCLSSCSSNEEVERSFSIISEMCKGNFAPTTEEEYTETYDKYRDVFVNEALAGTFFDIDHKTVHTNVTLSNYTCIYQKGKIGELGKFIATMRVSNGSIYTDIKVTFTVKDGKIVNALISDINT